MLYNKNIGDLFSQQMSIGKFMYLKSWKFLHSVHIFQVPIDLLDVTALQLGFMSGQFSEDSADSVGSVSVCLLLLRVGLNTIFLPCQKIVPLLVHLGIYMKLVQQLSSVSCIAAAITYLYLPAILLDW